MIAYKCDGSVDGILCCLYRSFIKSEEPYAVFSSDFQPSFDTVVFDVPTEKDKAKRVAQGVIKNCSLNLINGARFAMRSGDGLKETVIFKALKKCLAARKDISADYSDYDILAFNDLISAICKEIHRFKGFLRFEEGNGGVLYAHFEPDNDISDLLLPHFKSRFPTQKFIIHDVKRNIVAAYDGKESNVFTLSGGLTVFLSDEERDYRSLFKTYFNSVSIKERKNERAQDNFLPRRYRKNMTEFL